MKKDLDLIVAIPGKKPKKGGSQVDDDDDDYEDESPDDALVETMSELREALASEDDEEAVRVLKALIRSCK